MVALSSAAHLTFYVREAQVAQAVDLADLRRALESGDDLKRIEAMQSILTAMVNGEQSVHSLLMHIIRFIVPSKNKTLKKLMLLYLENVSKKDGDGKLRQEMILVWYQTSPLLVTNRW